MYKKTKWKKFEKTLNDSYENNIPFERNLTNDEIDSHIGKIDNALLAAIETVVPKYKPQDNTLNYVNTKIKKLHKYKSYLISTLNKALKKHFLNVHTILNIDHIKLLLNETNRLLNAEYRIAYTKYWDSQIKFIDHTKPEKFFPKINRFFRPKAQLQINSLSVSHGRISLLNRSNCDLTKIPRRDNNYIIHTPIDILNVIGAYFETVNAPRSLNHNTPLKRMVDEKARSLVNSFQNKANNNIAITTFSPSNPAHSPLPVEDSIIFLNYVQVDNIFDNLPNKSSSGLNNIPPIVLKHLPEKIIKDYSIIFNNCLNNKHFPDPWKQSKILPILKKGKPPADPTSYRPISLTPAISKVFEMVINRSLKFYTDKLKIIPDNQFGFRHRYSTTHAIHKILNDINSHLHKGEVVGACLIDIEKAFDSVWINGLLFILDNLKLPHDLTHLIWSSTTNRKFHTWNGQILSSLSFNIIEGLMQGTVNSPELFNIFTHSIPNLFNLNSNNDTHSAAFADDFIIVVANKYPNTVQAQLDTLLNRTNRHYQQWNLKINPAKCETILFHRPLRFLNGNIRKQIKNFKIQLHEADTVHTIEHKKEVRYLGVQLDYLLRLTAHINIQLYKAKKAFRGYANLFFNKSLSQKSKLICYMLLIRPIISYAAPIWWNTGAATLEKIRKFERSCLRTALHVFRYSDSKYFISNKEIYNLANIPRFDNFIIQCIRNYYAYLPTIENIYLHSYCSINPVEITAKATTGYLPPHSFLFFDREGYIQNADNVPILYHIPRHHSNKKFDHDPDAPPTLKYSMIIPDRDFKNFTRLSDSYWWLSNDAKFIDDIRRRSLGDNHNVL